MHTLTGDNARRDHFNPAGFLGVDRTLTVQRFAHRRDNPAEHGLTHRHLGNITGPFDHIAFFDMDIFAHNGDTHIVFFEVQHQAQDAAGKLNEFQGHDFLQTVCTGDTVTNR